MKSRYLLALAIGSATIASPYLGIPGWSPSLATVAVLSAISLIGLNLVFGYCGMLALGQAAFVSLAGYTAGILFNLGLPNSLSMVAGFLAAIALARLLAEIFIRLPGIYLAVGTLGFAYVVEGITRAFPSVTGGASGLILTPPFSLTENGWYFVSVVALGIALTSAAMLVRGSMGRTLKMVRRDELAAAISGIDVAKIKIRIFTIGSAYSAAGGLILAYFSNVIVPEMGGANSSLSMLAMVVIGGAGSVFGPVLGSVLTNWLFAIAGSAAQFELLVFGTCFLLVILLAPSGIAGIFRMVLSKFARNASSHTDVEVAPEETLDTKNLSARAGIKVDNVSKNFGGLSAVKNISFEANPGEVVALIGPNGAGKSTLFNLLSGLELPDEGHILFGGRFVDHLQIHERALLIGRSFQIPRMIMDMTVLQNVSVRIDHLRPDLSESQRIAAAKSQLARFGLLELSGKSVSEVAVGLHKLIDVARAAWGSPELVLLDEPAVGLSSDELARLRAIISEMKTGGATMVVIDHNLDFITSIADRVIAMESGGTVAVGPPDEVFINPEVRRAYMGALT
jgi:ABC-type branched-subunit amino acid transport system ATPase component/ABC-type branched-subunit amino acid transport system permease subunit